MAVQKTGSVFSQVVFRNANSSTQTADEYTLMAGCWAVDANELDDMFRHLQDQGYLDTTRSHGVDIYRLTTKGLARVSELSRNKGEGERAFVAMWFNPQTDLAYENAIEPAIRAAGYEPIRIDRTQHAGKIDDQIIMEIRRSRFMVADFTGQRQSVYYEAGFAQGRDIPIIWTCKEGEEEHLHFDTRQYNHVLWKDGDMQNFQNRLHQRIEAVIGRGPKE
jgi:nucleoside 2-deoxyribosyltransferase